MKKVFTILILIPAICFGQKRTAGGGTGTGVPVYATSPSLVTPALGTPSSGTLTNCTFPTLNQSTTGSAATLTTSRNINGKAFNGSADITTDNYQNILSDLGSAILAQPYFGGIDRITTTGALTNSQLKFTVVRLTKDATITGVKWWQGTAGSYTANNYNGVELWSISGGTMTLRAASTDDGNIWKATGNTWASKAFSSTYAATAGVYVIAVLYNNSAQTTAPQVGITTAVNNSAILNLDFTNSVKLSPVIASTTTLPSIGSTQAMSGTTANSTQMYFALY